MHSFLIAAAFVAILLSPCVAAQFAGKASRPVRRRPRRAAAVVEIEDPWPSAVLHERAELLRCVRTSQLRRIHVPSEMLQSASNKASFAAVR